MRIKKLFVSFFIVSLLVSCNKEEFNSSSVSSNDGENNITEKSRPSERNYSEEELFRGIFMYEGEVAKKIPSYSPYVNAVKAKAEDWEVEMISSLDELIYTAFSNQYPELLSSLKESIDSGNPILIKESIANVNVKFAEISKSTFLTEGVLDKDQLEVMDSSLIEWKENNPQVDTPNLKQMQEIQEMIIANLQERDLQVPVSPVNGIAKGIVVHNARAISLILDICYILPLPPVLGSFGLKEDLSRDVFIAELSRLGQN